MAAILAAAATLSAAWIPGPAIAQETIGIVRSSAGDATVIRGPRVLPAAPGTKLFAGDILSTGPDATLGIFLEDDSTLSLGPGSRLAIKEFAYTPAEGKLGLLARLTRGTMAYISGFIGKLAPEKVRFETPVATIGIRGTRFAVKTAGAAP
jgi:hypothetical protein